MPCSPLKKENDSFADFIYFEQLNEETECIKVQSSAKSHNSDSMNNSGASFSSSCGSFCNKHQYNKVNNARCYVISHEVDEFSKRVAERSLSSQNFTLSNPFDKATNAKESTRKTLKDDLMTNVAIDVDLFVKVSGQDKWNVKWPGAQMHHMDPLAPP